MTGVSESAGSGPNRPGAGGGGDDADAQERPKLVAVPEAGSPAEPDLAESPPDTAAATGTARADDDAVADGSDEDGAVADGAVEDGAVEHGAVADGAVADGSDADGAVADGPQLDPHAARLELERALHGPRRSIGPAAVSGPAPGASIAPFEDPLATTAASAPGTGMPAAVVSPTITTTDDAIAATGAPELVRALRAELAMRAGAEAGLRTRAVDAEARLATRVLLSQRTTETLRQVRAELDRLGELLTQERARRETADRRITELERELAGHRGRSGDADRQIAALRESLAQLRTPAAAEPPATAAASPSGTVADAVADAGTEAGEVRPERLADALTRLRARTDPIEPEPEPEPEPASASVVPSESGAASASVVPSESGAASASVALPAVAAPATLAAPFRTLCRRDPGLAGRLAVSLLGMQRIAYPHPIAYDVILGPGHGCLQVTSGEAVTEVVRQATSRPLAQVDLQLVGGPERLAKLLVAGRVRRRLGWGTARVRGNRDGLVALDALLGLALDLPTLARGGMLSDPVALLSLVAAMVSPGWTRGARFALGHRDGDSPGTYLLVADGQRVTVTQGAPSGPTPTVISCAPGDLAAVLTGSPVPDPAAVQVLGDTAPLVTLRGWIKRAQSE